MNARNRRLLRERQQEIEAAADELLALRNARGVDDLGRDQSGHPEPARAELHDDYEKLERRREQESSDIPPSHLKSYRNE